MNNHPETFKLLLLIAFIAQALIDLLGITGFYYRMYPEEIFQHSGHGAVLTFQTTFSLYLLWMATYYLSIIAMAIKHPISWIIVPLVLLLSFVQQPISGVYIGTPFEATIGWIGWVAYIMAISMLLFSSEVAQTFRKGISEAQE